MCFPCRNESHRAAFQGHAYACGELRWLAKNLRPPLPDCPMATKIGEKGGIRFATREEAIQARKQPLDSTMGLARAIKRRVRKWRLGLKSGWSIMCKGLNWTFQEG